MSIRRTVRTLLVLSLCLILGACSATRPMVAGPSGPQDLSRYVILIEKSVDAQVTLAWKPIEEFDLTKYRSLASARVVEGRIVRVSFDAAECEHQYDVCVPECQASTRIRQVDKYVYDTNQYGPWRTGKWSYCGTACMKQLANCMKEASRAPVKFEAIDTAVDWLKLHQDELTLGAVVVIAGVAFSVATLGGGVVLLVPILLFAELPR